MPRSALRRASGCLITSIIFLMLTTGIGLPTRYWLGLRNIHVLENKDEVVVLADVQLGRKGLGIAVSGSLVGTVMVLKIVVKSNGSVRTTRYAPGGGDTLSKHVASIAAVNGDLFLYNNHEPSDHRLLKFGPGPDLDPATDAERDALLGLVGARSLDEEGLSSRLDESLRKSGWRRLDSTWGFLDDVKSADHQLTLREERTDAAVMIVAESTSADRPWRKLLLKVDGRPWWSYSDPDSRPPAPAP